MENSFHQGNEEGTSFQNPSDGEVDEIVNPTAEMVQEKSNEKYLETINRINFQKWHPKVRIFISKYFEFEVIALIDSGADLNCIQEGIIPSKYFKKTRERLTSASGRKMQIEFKIPTVHVCQDNTCFKTMFVLVKNMTDRVILGNPFMCLLYPFITDSEGITTHSFGQPIKFKFLRSPKPHEINNLQDVSVSKTLNPLTARTHKKYNQAQNLEFLAPTAFCSTGDLFGPSHSKKSSQHIHRANICLSPSHVFNKSIFENSWKIHHAHLNMFWQENKISPTSVWKMVSLRNKGKTPMQGYPQEERLPTMGQSFKMHEGTSSGSEPRKATSLQSFAPAKITYSNETKAITLQEVVSRTLQYSNGVYPNLPPSIKILLDNLHRAYHKSHQNLF